jgi:hypothetical protein
MRDRHERLAQVVKDCLPTLSGEPILFRGCYLAGTGTDSVTEQAFASSVLRRLIEDQDNVTWTSTALLQDASFTRVARGLKFSLLCVIGLGIGTILWLIGSYLAFQSKDEDTGLKQNPRDAGIMTPKHESTGAQSYDRERRA